LVGSIQLLILVVHEWIWEQRAVFYDMGRRLAVETLAIVAFYRLQVLDFIYNKAKKIENYTVLILVFCKQLL